VAFERGAQGSGLERIGLCEWMRCVFVLRFKEVRWKVCILVGVCSGLHFFDFNFSIIVFRLTAEISY